MLFNTHLFFIGSILYWHMDVYIAKLFKLLGSSLQNTPSIFLGTSNNLQRRLVEVLTKGKLVWVSPIPVKLVNFFVSYIIQSKCNIQDWVFIEDDWIVWEVISVDFLVPMRFWIFFQIFSQIFLPLSLFLNSTFCKHKFPTDLYQDL